MNHQPTIVMYSPDTVGLGHVRRNSTIAREITARSPGASVVLLMGSPAGQVFELPPGVDSIKMPSVQKSQTGDFCARSLQISNEATQRIRSGLIRETIDQLRPDVFLVDHLPAGIWGELVPVFEFIRAKRLKTRVVLGLRDILDDPLRVAARWQRDCIYDLIRSCYDSVLIYGEEHVYASAAAYGLHEGICRNVRYAGYVSAPMQHAAAPAGKSSDVPHVVVTAGGGYDAFPMMQATIAALGHVGGMRTIRATAIAGPLMPADRYETLSGMAAAAGVELSRFNPQLKALLRTADAVVCMAGYNSMLEIGALGKSTIVIPRPGPSLEQTMRSQMFEQLGLMRHVPLEAATPDYLGQAILSGLDQAPHRAFDLSLNGAAVAAETILELAARRASESQRPARFRRPSFLGGGVAHVAT